MAVIIVGLNHRTVPLAVLERMAVEDADLPKVLAGLRRPPLREVVAVSTCNRTELYAVAEKFHPAMDELRTALCELSGLNLADFADHLYSYHDEFAIAHLFKVAAGLDSAVIGETEILGQLRTALTRAREEGAAGSELGRLFTAAISCGRRVRRETAIARGTASVSHAAVDMAAAHLGGLAGRHVLLLGVGEMGRGMAAALAKADAIGDLLVTNRTRERAEELAQELGGRAVPFSEYASALAHADVVLACTGATVPLISAEQVADALPARQGRPLLLVDVALPRDIEPAVRDLDGVTLLDLTDLKSYADAALSGRRQEVPAAQAIVTQEVERYVDDAASRDVAPLIAAMRARADDIREAELARFAARLGGLDERQRVALEAMTRGVVNKLLHEPTVRLREEAAADPARAARLADALRELFGLDAS